MKATITYTSFDGLPFSSAENCEKHEAEMLKKRDTELVPYLDVLEKIAGERPEAVFNPTLRACIARIVTDKTKNGEQIIVDAGFSGMHKTERPVFKVYSVRNETLGLRTLATLQFYHGTDRLCCLNAHGCYEEAMKGAFLNDVFGVSGALSFSVEAFINDLCPIIYDK